MIRLKVSRFSRQKHVPNEDELHADDATIDDQPLQQQGQDDDDVGGEPATGVENEVLS